MMGNDISTLNSLIATTLDSCDGYRRAAEESSNPQHQAMFNEFAAERETIVRQLQQQVRSMGGDPEDDGTVLAMAHRAFLSLRDAVTGSDDAAVIAEVERGEDHIKHKYEAAMDDGLSSDVEAVVRESYQSVRRGHDRVSAIKHMQDGQSSTDSDASRVAFADSARSGTSMGAGSTSDVTRMDDRIDDRPLGARPASGEPRAGAAMSTGMGKIGS
jgi:uncharacterized protein (TIGR02284 family)